MELVGQLVWRERGGINDRQPERLGLPPQVDGPVLHLRRVELGLSSARAKPMTAHRWVAVQQHDPDRRGIEDGLKLAARPPKFRRSFGDEQLELVP